MAALYERVGTELPLSLDVKDPSAFDAVVRTAEEFGAAGGLWLCHPDWRTVARWRERSEQINLVDSTRLAKIKEGPERRAMALRDAGIEAINMHHSDWSGGTTTLFHRFGIECFAWDAQQSRMLDGVLAMGVDAVYSDHVDRMVDALDRTT